MNKFIIIAVISVSILFAGCGFAKKSQQNTSTPTTSSAVAAKAKKTNTNQSYSITTETYSQYNIKIEYPQIRGLGDDSKEKAINDLIKNDILSDQIEAPIKFYHDKDMTIEKLITNLNCKVTMHTNELLSVIYTGDGYWESSAHPSKDVHAITIDLKNVTKLKLSDFTPIDKKLAKKIKQSKAVTNDEIKNVKDNSMLIYDIQENDDQMLIQGLKEQWYCFTFCVTPNSLVICVSVAHCNGDYALVEILGKYTNNINNK